MAVQQQQQKQSLDDMLSATINTPERWRRFLQDFIDPLRRVPGSGGSVCPDKRAGFPAPDPTDEDRSAYTTDRLHFASMRYVGQRLLYYTALLYHAEQQTTARENEKNERRVYISPLLREYNANYRENTYTSMVRPIFLAAKNETAEYSWCNNIYTDVRNSLDPIRTTFSDRVYKWKIYEFSSDDDANGTLTKIRCNSISDKNAFMKTFVPLQYYDWFPPNSVVKNWYFTLDANTSFIYSWYANYLSRISIYDDMAKKYGTANLRVRELEKTKEDNAKKYRNLLKTINNRYLSRDSYNAKYNMNESNAKIRQIREFNRLLEQLYIRFRTTLGAET